MKSVNMPILYHTCSLPDCPLNRTVESNTAISLPVSQGNIIGADLRYALDLSMTSQRWVSPSNECPRVNLVAAENLFPVSSKNIWRLT